MYAAAARRRTYLCHLRFGWVAFVLTIVEKHMFWPFPILFGSTRSLLQIHAGTVVMPPHTKSIVFESVRRGAVQLLHARFLPLSHRLWWHIHNNTERGHDKVGGCLLMGGAHGPPMDFSCVKVEYKRDAFAVVGSAILFPSQSNTMDFGAGKAPPWGCSTLK